MERDKNVARIIFDLDKIEEMEDRAAPFFNEESGKYMTAEEIMVLIKLNGDFEFVVIAHEEDNEVISNYYTDTEWGYVLTTLQKSVKDDKNVDILRAIFYAANLWCSWFYEATKTFDNNEYAMGHDREELAYNMAEKILDLGDNDKIWDYFDIEKFEENYVSYNDLVYMLPDGRYIGFWD